MAGDMLQNRVDPFGNIIKTGARGHWLGNRGVIHNGHQAIIRPFKLHAWITCLLEFKGRKRQVMTPDRWTELFFLDEATAFAAGHRPCALCRRADYDRFTGVWAQLRPGARGADAVDAVLHGERVVAGGGRVLHETGADGLPDGVFVLRDGAVW